MFEYSLSNIATSETMETVYEIITSPAAIIIYILFLAGVIIGLVVSNMNRPEKIVKVNLGAPIAGASAEVGGEEKGAKAEKKDGEEKAEDDEESGRERFCMLSEIDRKKGKFKKRKYDDDVTLCEFCDEFRNFAAGELKLYYDISDIRRFVAGLGVTHTAILQGMSGTGKTSLAYAMGRFLNNPSTVISVQPMWKERTDLIGYYNEFTKQFNETTLLKKMYEANCSKDIYITVLDEMNIARVEYYFAEFLSLLELPNAEERYLDVVSDKWKSDPEDFKDGQIRLPPNMWFIGTANNDDSTFAISDKVYDRAMIMNLDKKSKPFAVKRWKKIRLRAERFDQLCKEAQSEYRLTERNRRRLKDLDEYLIEKFHITFGNRIMKQIETYIPIYVSCGGDELDALDDILSKKILRKLEMQNLVYVRGESQGLIDHIEQLFGEGRMELCKEYIMRLQRAS